MDPRLFAIALAVASADKAANDQDAPKASTSHATPPGDHDMSRPGKAKPAKDKLWLRGGRRTQGKLAPDAGVRADPAAK
jgi:hypothetical protein